MKFPFKITAQERERGLENWNKQFIATGRSLHEGIWRRTQSKDNLKQSKWKSKTDQRWRVVHFLDNYDVVLSNNTSALVLKGVYLKINHSLPNTEAERLFKRMLNSLKSKKLTTHMTTKYCLSTSLGDLKIKVNLLNSSDNQAKRYSTIPNNYKIVDVEITGGDIRVEDSRKLYPWQIIKNGFRVPLPKGHPKYVNDIKEILKYKPFQVELGCGPSTEIGIYPLSYLHKIYQTTNPDDTFVFGDNDSLFEIVIKDPSDFYLHATKVISQSWLTDSSSSFYNWLKSAYAEGLIVGPVITNNYDGIISRLDIPEFYVRKFTDQFLTPKIKFNKKAKSLLVIGSHADRRLIQQSARKQKLKVIFIDPEQYIDDNGKIFSYTIEAPQDNDIVFKTSASTFADTFK